MFTDLLQNFGFGYAAGLGVVLLSVFLRINGGR